ncbi:MAG: thiol-disulfide oxidoreductase DCC family protein [Gemmataceae bacterium]
MNALIVDPAPGRGVVLFDGLCPFCRKSIRIIQRLDWFGRLHYQNCRDTASLPPCETPLEPQKLIEEMHVVPGHRQSAHAGFRAVRWMFWRLPATVLIAPLLYLPGVPWIGGKVYRWVARNRFQLVPCDESGVCQLPARR